MDAFPLPKTVRLPDALRETFGETKHKVFTSRVVNAFTSRGRRQRRILVVTLDDVIVCETDGTVRRMFPISLVSEAVVRDAEVLLRMQNPDVQPSLMYAETDDVRNAGMPPALDTIGALWSNRCRVPFPLRQPPPGVSLLELGNFRKGGGYQSPRAKLARMHQQTDGQLRSPTPTNSEVSDTHDRIPRPNSPVAIRRGATPAMPGQAQTHFPHAVQTAARDWGPPAVASDSMQTQLRELTASMRRQEEMLRSLVTQNEAFAQRIEDRDYGDQQRLALLARDKEELRSQLENFRRMQNEAPHAPPPTDGADCSRQVSGFPQQLPPSAPPSAPPAAWGVPAQSTGVQQTLDELHRVPSGITQATPMPNPNSAASAAPQVNAAAALQQLHSVRAQNMALEQRNQQLEAMLATTGSPHPDTSKGYRDSSRGRRKEERRRREAELDDHIADTKAQLAVMCSRVEDFERRNRQMAEVLRFVQSRSPSPIAPGTDAVPLATEMPPIPDTQRSAGPDFANNYARRREREELEALLDLKQRGFSGLDTAICQLQRRITPPSLFP